MKTLNFDADRQHLWFTSDLHLGHANVIYFNKRPYNSVQEMDESLIKMWNSLVQPEDIVFVLGDMIWSRGRKVWYYLLSQLNGTIYIIKGNHDTEKAFPNLPNQYLIDGFVNLNIADNTLLNKSKAQRVTVCHYPMLSWYQSHRGAWQLFGHWHSQGIIDVTKPEVTTKVHDHEVLEEVQTYLEQEYANFSKLRPTQLDVGIDGNNYQLYSWDDIKDRIYKQIEHAS